VFPTAGPEMSRIPSLRSGLAAAGMIAVLMGSLCSLTSAQNAPPPGSVAAERSITDVFFYPQPPVGLDPLRLSDAALEQYGFPPRPGPDSAPEIYSRWQRLVTAPQTRIADSKLQLTTVYNGRAKNLQVGPLVGGAVASTSDNWSGYALESASDPFKVNNTTVFSEFFVPIGQQAFGTCSSSYDWSSQWIGIDGFNSGDVLQAGTEVDASCSGGKTTPFYAAWYEWAPNPEVRITGLPVAPGDLMGIQVWYTSASPHGHAYLINYTTQKSTTIGFNAPNGTTLAGDSVEWIMERTTVNGGLPNLTNYVGDSFNFAWAYQGSKYFYPGSSPGETIYNISMICPPWTPKSACSSTKSISVVHLYGDYTMWFYPVGPAF
jgi:Peptidase A4 family